MGLLPTPSTTLILLGVYTMSLIQVTYTRTTTWPPPLPPLPLSKDMVGLERLEDLPEKGCSSSGPLFVAITDAHLQGHSPQSGQVRQSLLSVHLFVKVISPIWSSGQPPISMCAAPFCLCHYLLVVLPRFLCVPWKWASFLLSLGLLISFREAAKWWGRL